MKRWTKEIVLLLILLAGLDWWQARSLRKGDLPASLRSTVFETLDGKAQMPWSPDRYTILYVFAPWCSVCKLSANNLNSLLMKNLNVVSLVLSYEQEAEVQTFVRDAGLRVPVLLGTEGQREALGIESYPSYLLINQKGQIVRAWTGYTTTLGLYIKLTALRIVQPGRAI